MWELKTYAPFYCLLLLFEIIEYLSIPYVFANTLNAYEYYSPYIARVFELAHSERVTRPSTMLVYSILWILINSVRENSNIRRLPVVSKTSCAFVPAASSFGSCK